MVTTVRREIPRLGTRKLYYLLKESFESSNIKIGRDALFFYLKSENMLVKPKKNYTKTTNSNHWLNKYPNLYGTIKLESPEQVFVSDITYLRSRLYLSLVTDAYSRKIMGYKLSDNMNVENVVQALNMAVNGDTYLSLFIFQIEVYNMHQRFISINFKIENIIPSMTDGYDCYQNALAERRNEILNKNF